MYVRRTVLFVHVKNMDGWKGWMGQIGCGMLPEAERLVGSMEVIFRSSESEGRKKWGWKCIGWVDVEVYRKGRIVPRCKQKEEGDGSRQMKRKNRREWNRKEERG
jgi:hypothetical protein